MKNVDCNVLSKEADFNVTRGDPGIVCSASFVRIVIGSPSSSATKVIPNVRQRCSEVIPLNLKIASLVVGSAGGKKFLNMISYSCRDESE